MSPTPPVPWVVIVNADAGSSAPDVVERVVRTLEKSVPVQLAETDDLDHLARAVEKVADEGVIVVLGGDGSLHAVVGCLEDADRLESVVVGLVPLGTGNDFARTIGSDRDDPVAAATALLSATEGRIDLVHGDDGMVMVNAAHVGIGADAALDAEPWKDKLGVVGYAIGAVVSGVRAKGFRAAVTVDGETVPGRGRLVQVAIGNGRYIGGGTPLLPEADPTDGLVDVAISWADSRFRRLGYAWRLRKGRHPQRDDVEYLRGSVVTVLGQPVRGNVDGELTDPAPQHTWRVAPGALRMLLP